MIFLAAILAAGCANKPKDVLWLANGPVEPQGEPYYEYRILDTDYDFLFPAVNRVHDQVKYLRGLLRSVF